MSQPAWYQPLLEAVIGAYHTTPAYGAMTSHTTLQQAVETLRPTLRTVIERWYGLRDWTDQPQHPDQIALDLGLRAVNDWHALGLAHIHYNVFRYHRPVDGLWAIIRASDLTCNMDGEAPIPSAGTPVEILPLWNARTHTVRVAINYPFTDQSGQVQVPLWQDDAAQRTHVSILPPDLTLLSAEESLVYAQAVRHPVHRIESLLGLLNHVEQPCRATIFAAMIQTVRSMRHPYSGVQLILSTLHDGAMPEDVSVVLNYLTTCPSEVRDELISTQQLQSFLSKIAPSLTAAHRTNLECLLPYVAAPGQCAELMRMLSHDEPLPDQLRADIAAWSGSNEPLGSDPILLLWYTDNQASSWRNHVAALLAQARADESRTTKPSPRLIAYHSIQNQHHPADVLRAVFGTFHPGSADWAEVQRWVALSVAAPPQRMEDGNIGLRKELGWIGLQTSNRCHIVRFGLDSVRQQVICHTYATDTETVFASAEDWPTTPAGQAILLVTAFINAGGEDATVDDIAHWAMTGQFPL